MSYILSDEDIEWLKSNPNIRPIEEMPMPEEIAKVLTIETLLEQERQKEEK